MNSVVLGVLLAAAGSTEVDCLGGCPRQARRRARLRPLLRGGPGLAADDRQQQQRGPARPFASLIFELEVAKDFNDTLVFSDPEMHDPSETPASVNGQLFLQARF